MEAPAVLNVVNDRARGVKYHVMAYRQMTRVELLQAVAMYLRSNKGKHPKRGSLVTVVTIIGFDE